MIKNIIFDMGGVLIEWRPDKLIARLGYEGEDARLLLREVFGDQEWVGLDRGRVSEEEAMAAFRGRLPERLHAAVEPLVYWWRDPLWPVAGMAELIAELKGLGYGIYLLSNAASRQHDYWPDIPGSECFDGTLISADVLLTKPERAFFELFFERFGLDPDECVFIDDSTTNAEGAYRCGMHPIVFHDDVDELRQRLREEGVEL